MPGLSIVQRTAPGRPVDGVYEPSICFVTQGAKRVEFGAASVEIGEGEMIVTSVETPVAGRAVSATKARPFVAFSLLIDFDTVADLTAGMDLTADQEPPDMPITRFVPQPVLVDAMHRLAGLLDAPVHIAVLAPLIKREITYLLLRDPRAVGLRRVAAEGPTLASVRRVASWIKENPTRDASIADLAAMANMSVSTFHRHFGAATSLSPLQFVKQMRLHEARRLMLVLSDDAAVAAHKVGYESASQFAREYRRIYGSSPRRDIAETRRKARLAPSRG